jgi:hypothetical protein
MNKFYFFNKYIKCNKSKHLIQKVKSDDLINFKDSIKKNIPDEIFDFYTEVGFGFVWCDNEKDMINRILSPLEILDFYNREDIYEFDEDRVDEYIDLENELVFMEISELSFLTLDISNENENGECPVLYEGEKIANSLLDFLIKMEEKENYYIY